MQASDVLEFKVPFQRALLQGNRWQPPSSTRTAVLLHGGGTSAANGFQELRICLYAHNIATAAFDFVGHDRTGGSQLGTTLEERVEQVVSVVRSQSPETQTVSLVGFSM